MSLPRTDFISFEYMTSNEIAGPQDSSICSWKSKLCFFLIALHIYIPTSAQKVTYFKIIQVETCCSIDGEEKKMVEYFNIVKHRVGSTDSWNPAKSHIPFPLLCPATPPCEEHLLAETTLLKS